MIDISVIIPTYNYGHFILEAVNSVIAQDYILGDIEIIVVDDGSTDHTKEVLGPLIDNNTIKYYYQSNRGKANATSYAIQQCKGKYIFNLDADDYFLSEKISETVKVFETDDSIVHVSAPAKFINQETQLTGIEKIPSDIIERSINGLWLLKRFYNNNILFGGGSTYAARASILKSILIPDETDMFIDELLLLAVLPYGKSYFIGRPLSIWRIHNSNYSSASAAKDKQIKKEQRLLDSSHAILSYLEKNTYDKELVKIYRLQDETRTIVFKEICEKKKLSDIARYFFKIIFYIKPSWKQIKSYHVINRVAPMAVYKILKGIK
jgi:glycosyltransferase involved in cell wall biosynthesis